MFDVQDEAVLQTQIFGLADAYAVAGYDVSPILYLVKPFQDDQIAYALDIFLKKHQPSQILLDLTGEFLSLPL